MERIFKSTISVLLSIVLSVMCIPAAAFAAVENDTQTENVVVDEDQTDSQELSTLSATTDNPDSTSIATTGDIQTGYYKAYGDTYEYRYSDSYFMKSSYTYDSSLSTMSYNMAMAAFGSSTGTTDQDYANADSNIKDLMSQLGFKGYTTTDDFHVVPTDETVGAAFSYKNVIDENGNKQTIIAIGIRGGNYQQEWSGNATIGEDGEAKGFGIARDKVVERFNDFILRYSSDMSSSPKIWIAGFSRASAITNLTANYFNYCIEHASSIPGSADQKMMETCTYFRNMKVNHEDLFAYGFEVPAGGSDSSIYKCANKYDNIWNIVDPTDLVPLVAPSEWGFYRYGNDVDPTASVEDYQLEAQLKSISSSAYDSWSKLKLQRTNSFQLYECTVYNLLFAIKDGNVSSLSASSKEKSYKATYLNDFIDFLAKDIGDRRSYSENYEKIFSVVAGLMFSGANIDKIMDVAKDGIKDGFSWTRWAKIGAEALFSPSIETSTYSLKNFARDEALTCVEDAIHALRTDNDTYRMLGEDNLQLLEDSKEDLVNLVLDLLTEDAQNGSYNNQYGLSSKVSLVPTALYYKGELISAHDVNTVLAYLRCNDSNYTTVSENGSFVLKFSGDAVDHCQIDIKNQKGTIATYTCNGLTRNDESVIYSKNSDGSSTLTIAKTDANEKIGFEISGTSSEAYDIYLQYSDYESPGSEPSVSKDAWNNCAIPINTSTLVVLECPPNGADPTFGKLVYLDYQFVKYDETTGNYVSLSSDDVTSDITVGSDTKTSSSSHTFQINCAQKYASAYGIQYGCKLDMKVSKKSGTYTPLWAFTAKTTSSGYPQTDSNGAYIIDKTFNGDGVGNVSWTSSFNLKSLGGKYYVVCADTNTQKFNEVTVSALNKDDASELTGITASVSSAGSKNAKFIPAGSEVTVTMQQTGSVQYELSNWKMTGISATNVKWLNTEHTQFSFTMPEMRVDLNALYDKSEANPTIQVTGGWTSYYGSISEYGWQAVNDETYTEDQQLDASLTRTYYAHATDGTSSHPYFLSASEYTQDDGVTKKFDHWEVVQADGVTYQGANFARKVTTESGEAVLGDTYDLNGCTDLNICLDGSLLDHSVIVRPVYVDTTYTYNVTLSDGTVKVGQAKAGETITIENSDVPDGYTFNNEWTLTETPVVYNTDTHNYTTAVSQESSSKQVTGSTLRFTMPQGNVEASANIEAKTFDLTLTDPQIDSKAVVKSVVVDDEKTYADVSSLDSIKTGSKVTINFDFPEGYRMGSFTGLDGIETASSYRADGAMSSMSFTMPAKDLSVEFSYDTVSHVLKYENCTANNNISSGDKVAYGTNVRFTAAAAPEGKVFSYWDVESKAEGNQSTYQDGNGNNILILTMPAADTTVEPVYVDKAVQIPLTYTEISLVNGATLNDGDILPTTITSCSADGISESIDVTWYAEDGSVATVAEGGKVYKARLSLGAKSGYKFTDEFGSKIDSITATLVSSCDSAVCIERSYVAKVKDAGKQYSVIGKNIDWSFESSIGTYDAGDTVEILSVSDGEKYATFTGLTINPDNGNAIDVSSAKADESFSFTMPAYNLEVMANYTIDAVNLELDTPVAGKPLDSSITVGEGTCTALTNMKFFYEDEDGNTIEPSSIAKPGTKYTVVIDADISNRDGYTFSDDCTATINNQSALISRQGTEAIVVYTFEATDALPVPTVNDYQFVAPTNAKYDGKTQWEAMLVSKDDSSIVADTDEITFYYSSDNGKTWSTEAPIAAGTYKVKADIAATDTHDAVTGLTDDSWTFTVAKRAITITSKSAEKAYDGAALTAKEVTISGDGFATGESATYTFTGAQTEVGTSKNEFTYTLNTNTSAANYDITTVFGDLTVTAAQGGSSSSSSTAAGLADTGDSLYIPIIALIAVALISAGVALGVRRRNQTRPIGRHARRR